MSYSFDGSNDTLTGSFTSTYGDPLTVGIYLKVTAHPAATDYMVKLGNASTANEDSYGIKTATSTNVWQAESLTSVAAAGVAAVSASVDGAWTPMVATFAADNNRTMYVGTFANSDNNTAVRAVNDAVKHIRLGENLIGGNDFTGLLAEVAVWTSVLTQAQIESYMAGNPASGIAAGHLIGYWPLSTSNATQANDGTDATGDLTVSGATFSSDHPTIGGGGAAPKKRRTSLMGVG